MNYLLYTELPQSAEVNAARQTGIWLWGTEMAMGLAERGHRVTILTHHETNGERATILGPRVTVLRSGRMLASRADMIRRVFQVKKAITTVSPDAIIVLDQSAHLIFSQIRWFVKMRYSLLLHGTELQSFHELFTNRSWRLEQLIKQRLLGLYFNQAHILCCNSQYTANLLRSLRPKARSVILYPCVSRLVLTRPLNEINCHRLREMWRGSQSSKHVTFATVARISERKNQLKVLEILTRLHRIRGLDFQYWIVGNADVPSHQAYLNRLEEHITREHLEERVHFIHQTTHEQKVDYLDASDVFIMLSQSVGHSVEGFGISAIEASCRGKPIIVSNHGGMPETVIHGQTGFCVPLEDEEVIAEAIMTLASRAQLRSAMGVAGQAYTRERFVPRVMAEQLERHLATIHE